MRTDCRLLHLVYVSVIVGCVLAYVLAAACPAHGDDAAGTTVKAYNPFDEEKPRTPQDILDDKRLDQKIKVFVKGMNLKELFAALSDKTGVRLTAKREIWGDRAIIYFHNRPIRDVMTEISALYGYHWVVSGKQGAYSYELCEDINHAKIKVQRTQEQKERQDAVLLDLLDKTADGKLDENVSKRLQDENPKGMWAATAASSREHAQLLRSLGTDFLRRALSDGQAFYAFKDLPSDLQQRLYERQKAKIAAANDALLQMGQEASLPVLATMADMMDAQIYVRRQNGGVYGFPVCRLGMRLHGMSSNSDWPDSSLSEKTYRDLAGLNLPKEVAGDAGLPVDPLITKKELSWVNCSDYLRFGDVLQAIAEQSKWDIIADYRFQDAFSGLSAIEKRPLNDVTKMLSGKYDLACRADAQTIHFKFNDWFLKDTAVEPPAELLAGCWAHLEESGCLEFRDSIDLASLPEVQRKWDGLKLMPGAMVAASWLGDQVLVWAMLSDAQIRTAESEAGLAVAGLPEQQWSSLVGLAMSPAISLSADALSGAVIHVTSGTGTQDGREVETMCLEIRSGSKVLYGSTLFPPVGVDDAAFKKLIAQRKADKDAEIVELIQ